MLISYSQHASQARHIIAAYCINQFLIVNHPSSCLELYHSVTNQRHPGPCQDLEVLPLCSLFVKHTMSTLLATNGIAFLQWNLGIAITAEIVDSGIIAYNSGFKVASAESRRALGRWYFVGFARHVCCLFEMFRGLVIKLVVVYEVLGRG